MPSNRNLISLNNLKQNKAKRAFMLTLKANQLMKDFHLTISEIRDFMMLDSESQTSIFINNFLSKNGEKSFIRFLRVISEKRSYKKPKALVIESISNEEFKKNALSIFSQIRELRDKIKTDNSNIEKYLREIKKLESNLVIKDSSHLAENNLVSFYIRDLSTIAEEQFDESTPDIDKVSFFKSGGSKLNAIVSHKPDLQFWDTVKVARGMIPFQILYNNQKLNNHSIKEIRFEDKMKICAITGLQFYINQIEFNPCTSVSRIIERINELDVNERSPLLETRKMLIDTGKIYYKVYLSRLSFILLKQYLSDSNNVYFSNILESFKKTHREYAYEAFMKYLDENKLRTVFDEREKLELLGVTRKQNSKRLEESILMGFARKGTLLKLIERAHHLHSIRKYNIEQLEDRLDYIYSLEKRAGALKQVKNYANISFKTNYYYYAFRTNIPLDTLRALNLNFVLVSKMSYSDLSYSDLNINSELNQSVLAYNKLEDLFPFDCTITLHELSYRKHESNEKISAYLERVQKESELNEIEFIPSAEKIEALKLEAQPNKERLREISGKLHSYLPYPSEIEDKAYKGDMNNLVRTWNKFISQLNCHQIFSFKKEIQNNKISMDSLASSRYGRYYEIYGTLSAFTQSLTRIYPSGKSALGHGACTKFYLYKCAYFELMKRFEGKGYMSKNKGCFALALKASVNIFYLTLEELEKLELIRKAYWLVEVKKIEDLPAYIQELIDEKIYYDSIDKTYENWTQSHGFLHIREKNIRKKFLIVPFELLALVDRALSKNLTESDIEALREH